MSEAILGPRALPFIGNLLDLQDEVPLHAVERLVDIYGPIFKITIRGEERILVGGFDLFDELCNETRFYKVPPRALQNPNPNAAKGLFTAESEKDEDWDRLIEFSCRLLARSLFKECSMVSISCIHSPFPFLGRRIFRHLSRWPVTRSS